MRPDFQVSLDEVVAEIILSVLPCATIQWNHAQHVYKVGDKIEWSAFGDEITLIIKKLSAMSPTISLAFITASACIPH